MNQKQDKLITSFVVVVIIIITNRKKHNKNDTSTLNRNRNVCEQWVKKQTKRKKTRQNYQRWQNRVAESKWSQRQPATNTKYTK